MKNLSLLLIISLFFLSACDKENPVEDPPVAAFTIANDGCIAPCTVNFTNTSTNATTYLWDFGDGTATSADASPAHLYNNAGTYTAKLTATGEGGTHTATKTVTINAPQYFITFKADNTPVSLSEVSGSRNTTSNPRTLTIEGTAAGGSNPNFKFFTTETFIGFSQGLNIGTHSGTDPGHYTEYTNASGTLFSTVNDADGMDLFISDISYTNGGEVAGTFSGTMETAGGAVVNITEGKFKVQFKN